MPTVQVESPLFEDDQFIALQKVAVQRILISLQDFIWIHANNVEPYRV